MNTSYVHISGCDVFYFTHVCVPLYTCVFTLRNSGPAKTRQVNLNGCYALDAVFNQCSYIQGLAPEFQEFNM